MGYYYNWQRRGNFYNSQFVNKSVNEFTTILNKSYKIGTTDIIGSQLYKLCSFDKPNWDFSWLDSNKRYYFGRGFHCYKNGDGRSFQNYFTKGLPEQNPETINQFINHPYIHSFFYIVQKCA